MNKTTFLFFTLLFSLNLFAQETAVTSFTLVNADTDTDIIEITAGVEINLLEYPGVEFNIRANTSADVKSVRLQLSGALSNTAAESVAPYALYGDFPVGDYYGQVFPVGSYTIAGTPYSEASAGGTVGQPLTINFDVVEKPLQRPFMTTWKTDNPGNSEDNQITIPTFSGEAYNYKVEWGDGTIDSAVIGNITHTYETPGTYQVSIFGDFPRIYFHQSGEDEKIISVDQWGDIEWSSMSRAFEGCRNMDVVTFDIPDLSKVKDMHRMFTSSGIIGNGMFNQWDTSSIVDISEMFILTSFNQDISEWNVGKVTNMNSVFALNEHFNQDISNWDVANVTSMNGMFFGAWSFNQPIGSWDVGKVTSMNQMFGDANSFNQDITGWNVSNLQSAPEMFLEATLFNQNIGLWNIQNVTDLDGMFSRTNLPQETYDAILNGWSTQQLQSNVTFDGGDSQYCQGESARQKLIDDFAWTITDGGKTTDCPDTTSFITTWKTDNSGNSEDNQITIPTRPGEIYDYSVDWGDGVIESNIVSDEDLTHTYSIPGVYSVKISGNFPSIQFSIPGDDNLKLISIDQWGNIEWSSMQGAFFKCENLDMLAEDIPDLSKVTSLASMFDGCKSLIGNQTFTEWDVSSVINMQALFGLAEKFNQPIGNWNVSNVQTMDNLFNSASKFNQDISNWDVSNVTNMFLMFARAESFNQDLSSWDLSSINQTEEYNGLVDMFAGSALSVQNYDSTLIGWSTLQTNEAQLPQNVIFNGGNSQYCHGEEARQKLIDDFGWTITDGGKAQFCEEPQRPFITTWKTDNPGSSEDNQITIPTFPGEAYNYSVNWGDGTSDSGVAGDMTHTYETPGTYQVSISGDFPRIYFHNNLDSNYRPGLGDKDKLIEINQWGDMQWTSMKYAFYGCTNMNVVASDTPDFSNLFSLSSMFSDCKTLVGNETFADWNLSNVNNISFMFSGAELFNEDIGGWNTSNVLYMQSMFSFTNAFNQPIGQWDFSNARSIDAMFLNATAFNQDIGSWKFPNVTELPNMFNGATSFNQDISTWDVAAVTNFGAFLANTSSFDQDLSTWDISKATELANIFFNSGLSDENYDKIFIGWSQLPTLQNDVRMDAPQNAYCNAVDERQFIIDTYGWTINDLGQAFNCGPNQQRPFVMVWKTDNAGTSEANQITIPTFAGETYNYFVDWGDGTSSESVLGGITHTYPNPGTYTISILGEFPRIHFDDGGDKRKLLRVEQWGDISWKSMESAFNGCTLMDVTAKDVPDFSLLSSMKGMFRGCSSLVGNYWISNWDTAAVEDMSDLFRNSSLFNQFLGSWDVSNVKSMDYTFANASSFDQNLSSWNVSSVESMDSMLDGTLMSVLNYDRTLIAWSNLDILQQNINLGARGLSYCASANARQSIIDTYNWSIFDDMQSADCTIHERPFVTTWKTDNLGSSNNNQITIPTSSFETYNFTVDWGDGNISENVTETIVHTYANPGIYTISISGFYPTIYFRNTGEAASTSDAQKLLTVEQWGDIQWSRMFGAFDGCQNMDVVATDAPDLTYVKSTTAMFANCKSLVGNSSFGNWNMSQVEYTTSMFGGAERFNQDISGWDMGNVIRMGFMFQRATSFNQPIGLWNMSSVIDITAVFDGASSFNQPLNDWDVRNVTDLFSLFSGATSFNQPLDDWEVGGITDMTNLFNGAASFDQDLSAWNVSQVQNMIDMFRDAGISNGKYDSTLASWSTQQLQSGVTFNGGNSQYCISERARQKLIDDFGWTITDAGKALDCNPCPMTQVTLSTQQQVDDFAINYDIAYCTFEAGILIEGSDIVNLDGLSGLTYIDGFLNIVNTSLTNIGGLSSLTDVRTAILIENNSRLIDIGGLSSITVLSDLFISNNALLTNLDGLFSLTSIGSFSISDNTALTNIGGLASLTHVSDLVIQNNALLPNLDGLSSLKSISDSFILKNNAALTNIDGLSSLVFLDNDLSIEMNPMLTNVDGLSSLDDIGLSLSIQSNSALTNLDGLSSIVNMLGDLSIINNDILTNLDGLSNLNNVGGELNINGNRSLSDCAIDAVCDSDTVVGGTVTIFGNTGDCADISVATAACVEVVEANADLLAATYLQGSKNPEPTGPILRVEEGNREAYLKFDMSSFTGDVTAARLEMQVSSDPGNGFIQVFLGDNSNWTETGLNGSNKPMVVGAALASISGTHSLGQTKVWDIDVSNLSTGGELTLIVKHSNGNDVAFASDETAQAPKLLVTYTTVPEVQRPFITTWQTDNEGVSEDNQITIPTFPGETYDYTVEWGDGTFDTGVTGNITHTYPTPGTYQVSISGFFPRIFFNHVFTDHEGDHEKIVSINQWGDFKWSSMEFAFSGCANLDLVSNDVPDLTQVLNLGHMFDGCKSLIGNSSFGIWDVGRINDMRSMFSRAEKFNQDISSWDVSYVRNMNSMFSYASIFNQNISSWNVSNCTRMQGMFRFTVFNQDIGEWDMRSAVNVADLFANSPFNQDISNWNLANAKNLSNMFSGATAFNQNIGNWNLSSATHMVSMFQNATSFNQDIGGWDLSSVVNMNRMFTDAGLSNENYDALLLGWSNRQLQNGVTFDGGESQYCLGKAARQKLIDDFGWIITDGGKAIDCVEVVEGVADLIDATYLQGSSNPFPEGPILRAEEGNRVSYMKFDLSAFNGSIGQAQLKMQVASDPGNGTLEVFLGSDSNWTENNLNGTNKPTAVGSALASISGTHSLGEIRVWDLDVTQLNSGGEITLILKHSNGNDVAFASDETNQAPELIITSQGAASRSANTLGLSPNPASNEVAVGFEVPVQVGAIFVYDISGKLVQEVAPNQVRSEGDYPMDVSNLPGGMYFVRTFDADGVPHQKPMVIKH